MNRALEKADPDGVAFYYFFTKYRRKDIYHNEIIFSEISDKWDAEYVHLMLKHYCCINIEKKIEILMYRCINY